jgi:hypothetical protein
MLDSIAEKLATNPRRAFLMDGLGAVVSALALGIGLPAIHPLIGMPREVLLVLAAIPVVFALYSLGCAARLPRSWPKWLRGIAVMNGGYALLSMAMLATHAATIQPLGWAYFLGEIALLGIMAPLEWKIASRG